MRNTHTSLTTRTLLALLAALCLSADAAAQPAKGLEQSPAAKALEAGLRRALTEAVGEHFEVARARLARRSNWHGGQLYWLAHLRAKRSGGFYVRYKYRYKDHANPHDPLYTFVEHQTFVNVGPRGCERRPRYNSVCVGDTLLLPVLVNDYTEHTFSVEAQPFTPGDESTRKSLRNMEVAGLYQEPVPNPAEEFMKYVGRRAHYSPHRAMGYTMTFHATFEAVKPGSFNLAVGTMMPAAEPQSPAAMAAAGSVPVVVVAPGTPITVLSFKDDVHGYTERFSSRGGGTSYLTTPIILQVGERLTLQYLSYSRRGRRAGGENEEALEASVSEHRPAITLLPFSVDPARDFNEWLVEFLPPGLAPRPGAATR
ncbi:MAG TPA: hypothetical protein VFZ44_02355 [Pyrinomonadaceae bacterium]